MSVPWASSDVSLPRPTLGIWSLAALATVVLAFTLVAEATLGLTFVFGAWSLLAPAACLVAIPSVVALSLRTGFGRLGTATWSVAGLLVWIGPMVLSSNPPGVTLVLSGTAVCVLGLFGYRLTRGWAEILGGGRVPVLLYLSSATWPLGVAMNSGRLAVAVGGLMSLLAFVGLSTGGWTERFMSWRDRTLADPAFQRWAASMPLMRSIAIHRARRVFDLCSGFVFSQTLLACLRLGLFDELTKGPRSVRELAATWKMPAESVRRLLDAAEVLSLVQRRRGDRYGLGSLGAPLVGNDAVRAMAEHNLLLYRDMEDPVALLHARGGEGTSVGRYWPYAWRADPSGLTPDDVASYSELMTRSHGLVADEVLARYSFEGHRRHLDIGAGEAAFAERVARRYPHLEVTTFDLPAVSARARARMGADAERLGMRIVGGDFLEDPLPEGMDVVTLLRVLHDHDDAAAAELLARVHAAMSPGGALVVAEPMAGTVGSERVGAAYFSWYLHAMGAGRPRTPSELEALIRAAGFRRIRSLTSRVPVQTGLLTALR